MVQLKIAFLDEEEAYLERLRGYLVCKKEVFFQIWTFTDTDVFLKKQREPFLFDAVVMTERFWKELAEAPLEAKKILLCEGVRRESDEGRLLAFKYQSAEKLFCQILAMLWQDEARGEDCLPERAAELIGVYSPVHHEDQMLFGLTMAQILGENQNTLYVCLMENSGFYRLTKADASEDLGDLLYFMMENEHDFAAGLHKIRRSCKNFDYIPPVVNPEHLSELTGALMERFLQELKNRSGYDVVLVDFGRIFTGFAEMLPVFGSFYCLLKEGALNRYREEAFLEYLEKEDAERAAIVKRLTLPERMPHSSEGSILESGLYGGMGDYIRRSLYGGVEFG